MFSKLKQFKDLRDKAKQLQTALAVEKVEGTAAWGKVRVEMDGNQSVIAVHVADELFAVGQKAKLQDGVKDALNDAIRKAQRKAMETMKGMKDLNIPGLS